MAETIISAPDYLMGGSARRLKSGFLSQDHLCRI
jgi:hypothetical protein